MTGQPAIPFRILSLDGGGIRGAFIAGFLADVEARLGCRIADYFDLIAGTSTGAIIAAAIAFHEPAARIVQFYRERGPAIFSRREPLPKEGWFGGAKAGLTKFAESFLQPYGVDYDQLWQSKYEARELRKSLHEVFGDKKVSEAKTRILIPAVDLTRGQTIVFKTPHLPGMYRDRHFGMADVLMATTAAPTYFPHATIEGAGNFVDGGMWANNPSMAAIVEALKIGTAANRIGIDLPISQELIYLLSVGTGKATYFAKPPEGGAGIVWWARHLLNISSVAQSQGINFQAQFVLGDRAVRIDYDLPDGTWSLDNIDMLTEMIAIGRSRSVERLDQIRPMFFEQRAQHPYSPFPDSSPTGE